MKTMKALLFVGVLAAFGPACSQGADVELEREREPRAQARAQAPREVAAAPKVEPPEDRAAPCEEKGGDPAAVPAESQRIEDVQVGSSPAIGRADAPVTVVVFTDYECPFCKKAEATLREVEAQYGRNVRLVWKNHPLPFHKGARLAAQAALAAHEQGKFWEYHEALFAHQRELDRASLDRYAEDLGLDMVKFRSAIDSERIEAQVAADSADASRLGVAGTPTFFVNGKRVIGARPLADFQSAVDEALARRAP